jgi:hypothetical protein
VPQLELNVSLTQPVTPDPFILPVRRAAPSHTVVSASLSAPPPPAPRPVGAADDQTVRGAIGSTRLLRAQLDARAARFLRAVRGQWRSLGAGFAVGALLVAAVVVWWLPPAPPASPVPAHRVSAHPVAAAAALPPPAAPTPPPSPALPPEVVAVAAAEPPASPAPPAPSSVEPAQPTPTPGISVQLEGRLLRLTLPLIGHGRNSEQYRLVDPPGVAITLPRGRPRVITGVYRPEDGPVKVQVRRRAPGSHLRFFFDPTRYKGTVSARADQVVLELVERVPSGSAVQAMPVSPTSTSR